MKRNLEKIFHEVEAGPAGSCPLPEPGRGAPVIEHPDHLGIRRQPEGFNYDARLIEEEFNRFVEYLREIAATDSEAAAWAKNQGFLE